MLGQGVIGVEYTITSKDNKLVKHIKALHHRKNRDEEEQFFVEGAKVTQEALDQKVDILSIVICEDILGRINGGKDILTNLNKCGIPISRVAADIFGDISDMEAPQGILMVIRKERNSIENFVFNTNGIYIMLDGIQDPGNVGTIVRTADAIGADGVILSKGCADFYSPKTLRASMGSVFRVKLLEKVSLVETTQVMKEKGFMIAAASLQAEQCHFDVAYNGGVALVIGSESNGVSGEMLELADKVVKIPMKGGTESLNASVAAGVLMYEVFRYKYK